MDYKELIALSQKAADEWRNDHTFYQAGILIDSLCSAIENLLTEQNATNVAPVVHGRWRLLPVSIRSVKKTNIPEAVCSICGERFCDITNSVSLYRFCPNCGAKMDLK